MGYEIKLIIGRASLLTSDEIKRDLEKPFKDGSGYEYAKDEKGGYVKTGRKEHYFQVYATLDLCKLGYQEDELNSLIARSHKEGARQAKTAFHYFYADDGNTQIVEDRYGSKMWPVPVGDVLNAVQRCEDATKYRRLMWAIALLTSMKDDPQGVSVMFYGH
jgi:hypothetical protein